MSDGDTYPCEVGMSCFIRHQHKTLTEIQKKLAVQGYRTFDEFLEKKVTHE